MFTDEAEQLRWFLLPSEAHNNMRNPPESPVQNRFTPISKACILTQSQIEEYIKVPDNILEVANVKSRKSVVEVERCKESLVQKNENYKVKGNKQHEQISDKTEETQVCELGSCFIKRREIKKNSINKVKRKFVCPPKSLMKPTITAINHFNMIQNGDKVLVCLSGGKVSFFYN